MEKNRRGNEQKWKKKLSRKIRYTSTPSRKQLSFHPLVIRNEGDRWSWMCSDLMKQFPRPLAGVKRRWESAAGWEQQSPRRIKHIHTQTETEFKASAWSTSPVSIWNSTHVTLTFLWEEKIAFRQYQAQRGYIWWRIQSVPVQVCFLNYYANWKTRQVRPDSGENEERRKSVQMGEHLRQMASLFFVPNMTCWCHLPF